MAKLEVKVKVILQAMVYFARQDMSSLVNLGQLAICKFFECEN